MKKKFLIIDSRPYGLFSIFLHTIDNIKWAEDNGYIPVVRWGPGRRDPNLGREGASEATRRAHPQYVVDRPNFLTEQKPPSFNNTPGLRHCRCLYWAEEGWNGSQIPWEYYFEPLNEYTVETAEAGENQISDIFMVGEFDFDMANKFLIANVHSYEPLALWNLLDTPLEKEHRRKVHDIIKKHVIVKSNILEKVNSFYEKHFSGNVLGVHVRGTDKKLEYPHKALPMSAYITETQRYLAAHPDSKIYVASDNNEIIREMMLTFGQKRMIVHPSVRMGRYFSPDPICLTSATGPKHGEECLIETLLLAKTAHVICTDSNVAASALFMNPECSVSYLNRISGF
jgi:hypothetical protein